KRPSAGVIISTSAVATSIQAVSPVFTPGIAAIVIPRSPVDRGHGCLVALAGADPYRVLEGNDEDLAVADFAGPLDEVVGDGDLEAHLLREAHLHRRPAVGLDPLELAAVPLHAAHRDAPH